jgi:23S rRNA (uracil1939-C5)-methyltransferase
MQKNGQITMDIIDMGVGGEGIGRCGGMTFFVKDAIVGDRILARITKLKKNYGYARMEEILEPSENRVEPPCPLHRRCGGCQIQSMSVESQLAFKQDKVRNNLIRLGGFAPENIDRVLEPIVGSDMPFRYRNKAQFPIGRDKDGNPVAGFYAARTHSIIPVKDCLLGVEENGQILDIVLDYMKQYHISPYDEMSGEGLVRHVLIRYGFATKELMVALVINGQELPHADVLSRRLSTVPSMKSISININQENTNVILGAKTVCIWGEPYITDYIYLRDCTDDGFARTDRSVAFQISPQSFYQVNPMQTEKLYSLALEYAGLTGKEHVWDLYCGIGTISLFLAGHAARVYGVEIVPEAIEDARRNAALNGIENAQFFVGKAEEVLPQFYRAHAENTVMSHPDVIVVDPPRKGCDILCLETMLAMQPERIVYVSCDSATLARDLRTLCDGGYELRRVRPLDQFVNTVHVETVCLLSRKAQ